MFPEAAAEPGGRVCAARWARIPGLRPQEISPRKLATVEPVYRNLEFCRNAETLWSKLHEGGWEWLGVHPEGQFVLGSPRRSGVLTEYAAVAVKRQGVSEGVRGFRVFTEPQHQDLPESQDGSVRLRRPRQSSRGGSLSMNREKVRCSSRSSLSGIAEWLTASSWLRRLRPTASGGLRPSDRTVAGGADRRT